MEGNKKVYIPPTIKEFKRVMSVIVNYYNQYADPNSIHGIKNTCAHIIDADRKIVLRYLKGMPVRKGHWQLIMMEYNRICG